MMHHPNMHHQPMSGHPPQHMPGHQAMPTHHQMPPHQMHRENRHVALTRVGLGGGQPALGPALGVHPAAPRPPHAIRAMHHPPAHHHPLPPQQLKPLRRAFPGGSYGGVLPPPYAPPPPQPQPPPVQHHTPSTQTATTTTRPAREGAGDSGAAAGASETGAEGGADERAAGDAEAARPSSAQANSKEKTPMCLVNELARYNKIKHQYRLTSETGPAHKKVFTVTLRLGDAEEYTAEGSSIKRAQHAAASAALGATSFPPPPPRALAAHAPAHPHHRHAGAVMPTVELNALAMKLCQPAVYTVVAGVGPRLPRGPFRLPFVPHPRLMGPGLLYRVRVAVGGRVWLGEGVTPQAARHDAAARALQDLRPPQENQPAPSQQPVQHDTENGETNGDILNSEVKSPVSLVHELALKRNLSVQFTVKSERGPPHMRVFITACIVGDMETEGEGNGKKVSKRRAAGRMLAEMQRRWPPALLRPRSAHDKRRHQPAKKKPRNLIKEGAVGCAGGGGADNPISRLAVARHAVRARSPQYRVLEERGAARRREFLVQCDAPPHSATGLGPNKKTAKRRAAHNVLLAMELGTNSENSVSGTPSPEAATGASPDALKNNNNDTNLKDSEGQSSGGSSDVRQPVPGVLLMDYHQRSGQPHTPNSASESSANGGSGGSSPGAKDKLMYLSQLLGFTVQFSDFPKRNHGEYLSLVSLSTEPPVMCHGGGPSTGHSHEQCSRAALRALTLMGLDTPQGMQSMPVTGAKASVISNGVSE